MAQKKKFRLNKENNMPLTQFGTPREKQVFLSEYRKTLFVDMNSTSTVRILTDGYLTIQTHFINRATVQCLGENCPICASNKMLQVQYPDTFRDEPKYAPRRTVNLVNVLDKTPVMICPKCGAEIRTQTPGPRTCVCGEIVTSAPVPSNKVKVLSRGVTLFDQLDAINNAILDTKGERIGLTGYDLTFVVSGTGKNKTITPIAGSNTEKPVVNDKDLFDLEAVTIKLSATELVDLQRGVSLKDIFSARRASEKSASIGESLISKEVIDSVNQDIESLFKN
jgi:hypothetical protein